MSVFVADDVIVVLAAAVAYTYAIALGRLLVAGYVQPLWDRLRPTEKNNPGRITTPVVGFVEEVIYVTAVLANQVTLIGFWLVLKAVVHWKPWNADKETPSAPTSEVDVSGRHLFNIFLIGSGTSLMTGLTGGFVGLALANQRWLLAGAIAIGGLVLGTLGWSYVRSKAKT